MSHETASASPEGTPRIPQIKAVEPEMAENPAVSLRAASPAGTPSPIDFGRLRPGDLIAGIGSLLVLISLYFPWYGFTASAAHASAVATPAQQQLALAICADQPAICSSAAPPQFSVTALGAGAGGWRFLILVVAIIALLYVPSRALEGVARAFRYHWQVLVGLTVFQALLVLVAFAANPLDLFRSLGSSSWAIGAFLALLASLAAVVGAAFVMQEKNEQPASGPVLR